MPKSLRPCPCFLCSPLSSRTAGFPRSGWKRRPSPHSLPSAPVRLKRWHTYTDPVPVCCRVHHSVRSCRHTDTFIICPCLSYSEIGVFAQGPFALQILLRFVAPMGPCENPDVSHPHFSFSLIRGALAACAIHGCSSGFSRLYSVLLSRSAMPSMPAAHQVHSTSSSLMTSAFVPSTRTRLSASSHQRFQVSFGYDTAGIPYCYGPPVCSPSWPFGTKI